MKTFHEKVNMRSRKAMVEFLTGHFRYDTTSSWNRSTSYANNLKIYNLGLTREQEQKLYEFRACDDDCYSEINALVSEFGIDHDYKWQAGFNGRSGGYLVLYQGGSKPSEHKSVCTICGQRNFRSITETGCKCGRCGNETRIDYKFPPETFTYPGKATDMNEDFEDWSMDDLRARVKLVQEFDKLCDSIVKEAINLIENYEIEEEEVYVPKTIRKLVAVG